MKEIQLQDLFPNVGGVSVSYKLFFCHNALLLQLTFRFRFCILKWQDVSIHFRNLIFNSASYIVSTIQF